MLAQLAALRTLIDEIFDFTRLEAGDVEWTKGPVDLAMLIRDTADVLAPQAHDKHVELKIVVPPDLRPVLVAPEKIERVLVNLIANALEHTAAGGFVQITASQDPTETTIEVADTGPGVDPADRLRIFEPFYRGGAKADRPRPGTGLGLSIAHAIVEAHAGRLWVVDAPGGARFRFTLPRADPAPQRSTE